jgi:hypothetical protein
VFSQRLKYKNGCKDMDEHQKELLKNLPKIDEMMLRIEKRGNLLMLRAGDDRKNAPLRILTGDSIYAII